MTDLLTLRRFFAAALCLLCLMTAQAAPPVTAMQQQQIDSLKQVMKQQKGEELRSTSKNLFMLYYVTGNTDKALALLDKIIAINDELGDEEGSANARWNKIAVLNNSGRYKELENEAPVQMAWFEQHKIWGRFYQAWQRKASAFHDQKKSQTALRVAQQMREDAQRRNNDIGKAMAYKQMGIIYADIQQHREAATAFERSIELLHEDNDSTGMMSGVYDYLCKSLDAQGKYQQELNISQNWLKHIQSLAELRGVGTVYGPLCSCHLARAAANIGLHNWDSAEKELQLADEYNQQAVTPLGVGNIYQLRARLAMATQRPQQALAYIDSATATADNIDADIKRMEANALLQLGRSDKAARIYRDLLIEKDTTFSRDMRTQLDELNTLFKVDELRMQQKETQLRYILIIGTLVFIALMLYLLFKRRTARRLAQKNAELQIANEQAEASSKMKSEFIKNISHEIRTPLNILSGFTQVITTPGLDMSEAEMTDIRQRIEENTNRITGLVNKMLELSDANSQSTIERNDNVPAMQIAAQAAEHSRITQAEHIAFELKADEPAQSTTIKTDLMMATRALTLLLDNAQKFTKQGTVTLSVDLQRDAPTPTISFVVEDTGIGIAPEQAEHVFEEFVQLDSYSDGTGIGLTVARSIARRLGGDIVLDTNYTGGARFVFNLPA